MMKKLSPLKVGLFAILASSAVLVTTVNAEPGHDVDHSKGEKHASHCPHNSGEHANYKHMDGKHGMHGMHGMFEGLDLTDEQKANIEKLYAEQKAASSEGKLTKEERVAHHSEMQALVTSTTFDETKAKALLSAQQEKRQAQAIERIKMQNKIYNMLTPEQQTKFKAQFEAHTGKEPRG